ncbi:hypothetical protein WICPIJ_007006 [Wickerhamomyces pijperi]|uniref:Elongator complex protein 2 n=1 Tax=Wickerhamomyces pijperi TaxID=599730 RepID=A0A9P8Q365_WICPI|nr:hypothetical protein WICPIJ_007006 [Wickerhamomyces pijperi]
MSDLEAIFIGANRQPHVSSVHATKKIIAYGAGKTIALWDPVKESHHGVYSTLKGHEGEVTCVRFIPDTQLLVTAAEDSTVRVWKFINDQETCLELEDLCSLEGHTESIITIGLYRDIFVTGDSNGKIILWRTSGHNVVRVHEFQSEVGVLPLALAIQEIEKNQYVLALGGSKFQISIYTFTLTDTYDATVDFNLSALLEGHEDWVKALAFKKQSDGDYFLASGSQDRYIRLWRIRTNDLIDRSDEDESKLTLLSNKQYKFNIQDTQAAINFEALIMGHDDWIASLQWNENKLALLASGADTNMMIFEPDTDSGIWVSMSQLGEISTKGASTATGSSGGFFSALWFEDSRTNKEYVLTNGKTGAWRKWTRSLDDTDGGHWVQELAVTGSTKKCTDISWSINGEYLMSTSLDQTTRLYSQWLLNADGTSRTTPTWQEFARPQIHGYDMICLATLSNTRFISGGDEKILRSFDEPKGVAHILKKFCNISIENDEIMPESASLPALGLSNKATSDEVSADLDDIRNKNYQNRETNDTNNITFDILDTMVLPPLEDHLQRHTLWPEIEKLYGHGYEIASVDTSQDKKLVATSCKSNTTQHAVVRIYDAETWQELKPNLRLHDLTVTRVKFSPCDKYLLTVSRDRKYGVWTRNLQDNSFELISTNEKAHSRIIWDCSWAPSEFGSVFITGSRDKSIKVWRINDDVDCIATSKFSSPVTSLDVHTKVINGKLLVSVGLETGDILLYTLDNQNSLDLVHTVDAKSTPDDRISRINWSSFIRNGKALLALTSYDHSTRIYSFNVENL